MLLFRRLLDLAGDGEEVIPLTASFYRRNIDAGYQALVKTTAANGGFDEYILRVVKSALANGKFDCYTRDPLSK